MNVRVAKVATQFNCLFMWQNKLHFHDYVQKSSGSMWTGAGHYFMIFMVFMIFMILMDWTSEFLEQHQRDSDTRQEDGRRWKKMEDTSEQIQDLKCQAAQATKVSLEIQSTGGDRSDRSDRQRDILDLGWEAFLDAIGVTPLSLSDVSDDLSLSVALGRRDPKGSEGR